MASHTQSHRPSACITGRHRKVRVEVPGLTVKDAGDPEGGMMKLRLRRWWHERFMCPRTFSPDGAGRYECPCGGVWHSFRSLNVEDEVWT